MFTMNAFTNNRKSMSEELDMFGDKNEEMNNVVTEELPQLDLCKEMMENYICGELKYLHDTSPNEVEKDTVEEVVVDITSFDGNDSMEFNEERKAAFVEYYRLKRLYFGNEREFYVAPNRAVVYFYELGSKFNLELLSCTFTKMKDVVKLLAEPKVNTDFEKLFRMMQTELLFPGDKIAWENVSELVSHFGETCITGDLQEYAGHKFMEEVEKCKIVKLPEVGSLVRRINIVGDGSYSEYPLKVLAINKTCVTLQNQDAMKMDFNTSLADFWNNFEPMENLVQNAAHLLQKILWLLLDEELIQNLENGIYTEREPRAVQANDIGMYSFVGDELTLTIFSYINMQVVISLKEVASNSNWMVGSPLDLPLVLNEYMKGKSNAVKSVLQDKISEYCRLVNNILREVCHSFGNLEELKVLQTTIITNLNNVQAVVDRL